MSNEESRLRAIRKNYGFQKRYKNHLCRYCKHLTYWDWYRCNAKNFKIWDYGIIEIYTFIKNYIKEIIEILSLEYNFQQRYKEFLKLLPDKPIKRCKKYKYQYRDKFWKEE
ncbi:MAG TPA: hypothetical protein DC057_02380 [Spirochaetia bacterium]|nr:hypothetical protein [Spirochaetia bacterium]